MINRIRKTLRHLHIFFTEEDGPTAVEYAVMLALIVVACIGSIGMLSVQTQQSFNNSATGIANAL
jgi:pilus assembly protein Flp/PilA